MEAREAQERAIKLTMADKHGESGAHMDDHEGKVHTCPNCGHEMPMDEVMANANSEHLTEGERAGLEGAHMDHEGNLG